MMIPITLGTDLDTKKKLNLDPDLFRTHFYLVGATGTGKTNAIHTILRPIMIDPTEPACVFVIDPMGNLSHDLLRWMASPFCTQGVRDRLVYIEPARENVVLPFNPLLYNTEAQQYYQVARAVDLVLRAWDSQEIAAMPRLRQWTYKAFFAVAALGYPIAACRYLVHPGTDEHNAILRQMPEEVRHHWLEILNARGGEPVRILESTRNRLDPFFESVILRRMFGIRQTHFDVERFIRERRIVILNLAPYGRLTKHDGRTIGALAANEVFEKAFEMATTYGRSTVDPTYVLMDEFQHFVNPDIEDALPTVRQMGLRLILAHQAFHQLERGEVDLNGMIWQARSRLMFANDSEDADLLAHELATRTFDPMKVKDVRKTIRQIIVGYRKEWLSSFSATNTRADASVEQQVVGYNRGHGETRHPLEPFTTTHTSGGQNESTARGSTHANSNSDSQGKSEALVPVHQTFEEVANVTYKAFDEYRVEWAQRIRKLRTGHAFGTFANDDNLYSILIDHDPIEATPSIERAKQELIESNFEQDFFISAEAAEREAEEVRQSLLQPRRVAFDIDHEPGTDSPDSSAEENPFCV